MSGEPIINNDYIKRTHAAELADPPVNVKFPEFDRNLPVHISCVIEQIQARLNAQRTARRNASIEVRSGC